MDKRIKQRLMDFAVAVFAVSCGAVVIYIGDMLLGVRLELFYGIATFTPAWILDLFLVPFIGGFVVSLIYGLGGKILAHFAPLIVRLTSYYQLHVVSDTPPQGAELLPMGYWILVVIVAVEFAAIGGFVGEVVIKKTYGREGTPRQRRRKRAAKKDSQREIQKV